MKAGSKGALIVLAGALAVSLALLRKDAIRLEQGKQALERGKERLARGDAAAARRELARAVVLPTLVSGLTGRRAPAFEIAEKARAGVRACDAIVELEADRPDLALRGLDGSAGELSERLGLSLSREQALARTRLALLSARALEKGGASAFATRAYEAILGASSGKDREDAALGLERLRVRATLARARDALSRGDFSSAKAGSEEVLAALGARAPVPGDDRGKVEAEAREIRRLVATVDEVTAFGESISRLRARAPLEPEAAAKAMAEIAPPVVPEGHPAARELASRLERSLALRSRLIAKAKGVEGMVLAVAGEGGRPFVYVDAGPVTNAAYAVFVEDRGYEKGPHWDADGEFLRGNGKFVDRDGRPGPRGWRGGRPDPEQLLLPVVGICVHEARAFARWAKKRLPTRNEWQRVGSRTGRGVREIVESGRGVFAVSGLEVGLEIYPSLALDDVGFRCAKELSWEE